MSDASVWLRSAAALATIGSVLLALNYGLRLLQRGVAWRPRRRTMLAHVETLPLPGGVALHVVRIAGRLYAVGGGQGHISPVCEISRPSDSRARERDDVA